MRTLLILPLLLMSVTGWGQFVHQASQMGGLGSFVNVGGMETPLTKGLILYLNSSSIDQPHNKWLDLSDGNHDGIISNLTYLADGLKNAVGQDHTAKVKFVDSVFSKDNIYSVLIKVKNYQHSNDIDAFIGGATDNFFSFARPNYYFAYRQTAGGTYVAWDGTGNTEAVRYISMENGTYKIAIRSDGTNIYLNVNGDDKGYITPSSTAFTLLKLFEGYVNDDYSPKMEIQEVRCFNRCVSEAEVTYWNTGFVSPYNYFALKNFPDTIYTALNHPMRIAYNELDKLAEYNLTNSIATTYGTDSTSYYVAKETTQRNYPFSLFGLQQGTIVDTSSTIIKVIDTLGADYNYSSVNVVMIGNSIISRSSNYIGTVLGGLLDKNGDVPIEVYSDGNSGWTAAEWNNSDHDSPLFASTTNFSLSAYLNSEFGISSVDVFVINLGVNDVFSTNIYNPISTLVGYVKSIADSVLAESPTTKIIISLQPSGSEDGTDYSSGDLFFHTQYNFYCYANALIAEFDKKTNIELAITGYAVDRETQFDDLAHPSQKGLSNMAYNLYPVVRKMINSKYGKNLFTDPEFEYCPGCTADDGTTDNFGIWGVNAVSGKVEWTTGSYSGVHAMKITNNTGGTNLNATLNFTVTPSTDYNFSFYTKGDGTNSGYYRIYNLTGDAEIKAKATTGISSTTYTKKSILFTTPSGCVSVRFYLYGSGTNGSIIYFDKANLRKVNP